MKLGQVSASIWVLVGLTGLISAGALLAWAVWTDNLGVGERMMASFAHVPLVALALLGIPLFAVLNAATEEAVFRGVFHYEMGFPHGPVGYVMVFVYGLALGCLRMRTGGLLAPIW